MRLLLVLWTPLLLAGLLASAATAIEGGPENKVPRVLESEPRLERRVTLSERRIYLGELLERISAQTGTHLKADDRSAPISGYQVTVTVWDQPARDVLDALARLYSAPPDRWFWAKEGRDGEERYVLHNTLPATQVDSVHEASVEEYVLSEHQRLRGFYSLPPERRAALAATDPALRALSDPLAEMHFSFVSSLSSSEVRAILWGKRLSLPASRLTPAQVNYLREWWGIAGPVEDEGDEEREAGQKVSLWRTGAHDPSITLLVGSTEVGTALSGVGLPRKLRARSQQAWLAADERKDISARRGAVPRGKIRHEDLHVVNLTLDTITHRLGRLGRVNLLFDCPPWIDSQRDTLEQNMIGPLPDLLQAVEGLGVTWKRRGEFYLLRKADTETVRRTLPTPWPLPRTLRASAKANQGYLRPADWLQLSSLTREQLEYLSQEYPDADTLIQHRTLLRLAAGMGEEERAAAARPEGAGWADLSEATRSQMLDFLTLEDARTTRMVVQWEMKAVPPLARLYLGTEGRAIRPMELRFQPRREPAVPGVTPRSQPSPPLLSP